MQAIIGRISSLLGLAGITLPTLDFTAEGLFDTLGGLGIEGITYDPGSVSSGGTVNYPNTGTLTINIAVNDTTTIPFSISEAEFIQFLKDVEGCGAQSLQTVSALTALTELRSKPISRMFSSHLFVRL